MCELPSFVLSAISNLVAAAIAAIVAWAFVAGQRAMRLNEQLNQLARIVRGTTESHIERIWRDENEREKAWNDALKDISADVIAGSDRLVRLNAHSKRMLEGLTEGIYTNLVPRAKALLLGESRLPIAATGSERLLQKIEEFQKDLGILSFVELPWQRWRHYKSTSH